VGAPPAGNLGQAVAWLCPSAKGNRGSAFRLLRDPVLLAETVILEFAVFALDALTLWLVFRALGDTPAIWVAFVSFIMTSMAATLGPIPLGVGTFEAACVGMLSLLGIAIETALAATLLLRGVTFWLPMVQGLWLAKREIAPG
jgi:glycosyltransferase 2 family protein